MDLKIEPELERCLPPLPESEYQRLKARIEKKYDPGKPIVLWKERPNTIVDGHHRYRICQELDIEPVTVEESFATLEDAVIYALESQLSQRNLSDFQKIGIQETLLGYEKLVQMKSRAEASRLSNLKTGDALPESVLSTDSGESQEVAAKIAEKAKVPVRSVYFAKKIKAEGVPELINLTASGDVSVVQAGRFVSCVPDKENQSKIIESGGASAVAKTVQDARKARDKAKQDRKDAEEAEKFAEFRKELAQETHAAHIKNDHIRSMTNGTCLLPNVIEKWCEDCQWGFDIYLPLPKDDIHCPYCRGDKIVKRDPEWNPRELI